MIIENWHIDAPKDYPKNARKWSSRAVEVVAASIQAFGWRQPVVVDSEGVIIIGHLRRAAGKSLGLTHCPVHVASDLSPEQVKALRLADNRSSEESAWDLTLLKEELIGMQQLGFDLNVTGFNLHELERFTIGDVPAAADETPAVPEGPTRTHLGTVWRLGEHRLICGDATDADTVSRLLMFGRRPFLMVTDPPYGVEYDPAWRNNHNLESTLGAANRAVAPSHNDDRADWTPAWRLFTGDVAYVWHAGVYAAVVQQSLTAAEFETRAQIIWRKQHFVMSRGAYHWGHEPCWYAVRKGANARWCGDRKQSTVWDVANLNPLGGNREEEQTGHSAQKPVEIMRRPILNHTSPGEVVYDPFLGSGSTLVAAELTGRVCLGVELDPRYCDVIVERWEKLTGKQATLYASEEVRADSV